jgi:hypothetical protein
LANSLALQMSQRVGLGHLFFNIDIKCDHEILYILPFSPLFFSI